MRRAAKYSAVLSCGERVFEDAVAYRFATGQSVPRIRRLYRVRRVEVEQALRGYMNRRTGK